MDSDEAASALHRRIGLLMLMDVSLGSLVARPWAPDGSEISNLVFWNIAFFFTMLSWFMFHRRNPRGIRLAGIALVWFGTMMIAAGIEVLLDSVTNPSIKISRGFEGVCIAILGLYSLLRIEALSDARFISWYHTNQIRENGKSSAVNYQEYRAVCPSCTSLLAVVPSAMTAEDTCPHCQAPLIPTELTEES
jgi:hypothetical protein